MKLTDIILVLGLKNRLIWDITFDDDGTGAGAIELELVDGTGTGAVDELLDDGAGREL